MTMNYQLKHIPENTDLVLGRAASQGGLDIQSSQM